MQTENRRRSLKCIDQFQDLALYASSKRWKASDIVFDHAGVTINHMYPEKNNKRANEAFVISLDSFKLANKVCKFVSWFRCPFTNLYYYEYHSLIHINLVFCFLASSSAFSIISRCSQRVSHISSASLFIYWHWLTFLLSLLCLLACRYWFRRVCKSCSASSFNSSSLSLTFQ